MLAFLYFFLIFDFFWNKFKLHVFENINKVCMVHKEIIKFEWSID